ncbi:MAG TPA: RHS repeat-associated core domain-containing protein [Vicinamibacterales bacterium]|nr:RHS repeat-associated core domain-containing protein [Vicinamibacterales bacterium]
MITLRPGVEAEEVIPSLSAIVGSPARVDGESVHVSMTASRARLLEKDGRVVSVERVQARAATDTIESWSAGVSYGYDGAGNIRSIGSNVYVYDQAGRLKSGTVGGASNKQTFTYDAFGNRTNVTRTGLACAGNQNCEESPPINAATNRLKSSTVAPAAPDVAYDQAGNLTKLDYSYTYTYDAAGSMTKQVGPGGTREYVYTASDERIGVYNGSWSWTVRDLGGRVLREYTSTGTTGTSGWRWRRDHIYRGSLLLASIARNYDGSDQPLTTTTNLHFHLDHLGTPRVITNDSAVLAGEHAYYPFGPELSSGTNESPRDSLRFTGHERDDIADIHSLDYMHARYYSGAVGRFLAVDPVLGSTRSPQSWNGYSYVENGAINSFDPDGRCSFTLTDGSAYNDSNPICAEVTAHWSAADLRQRGDDAVARERTNFLKDGYEWYMSQRSPVTGMTAREHWRATGYGGEAFVDGVIPFGDPLEDYYSDGSVAGLEYSRSVGEYTRDTEIAIATSGSEAIFGQGRWLNTGKNLRIGQSTKLIKGAANEVWFSMRGQWVTRAARFLGSTVRSPHWNLWIIRYFR